MADIMKQARVVTDIVHGALLRWITVILGRAGLSAMNVSSELNSRSSSQSLTVFPYRVGPEAAPVNTARPVNLLSFPQLTPVSRAQVPEPWDTLGILLSQALIEALPKVLGTGANPSRPPVLHSFDDFPLPLKEWYQTLRTVDEREPVPDTRHVPRALRRWYTVAPEIPRSAGRGDRPAIPSLTWHPGVVTYIHYVACVQEFSPGTAASSLSGEPTPVAALTCIMAAINDEQGFDALLPVPVEDLAPLVGLLRALSKVLEMAPGEGGDLERRGHLSAELRRIAGQLPHVGQELRGVVPTPIVVEPTQDISNSDLFNLMQAIQRPVHQALCFKVGMRLGDRLLLDPAGNDIIFTRFLAAPTRFKATLVAAATDPQQAGTAMIVFEGQDELSWELRLDKPRAVPEPLELRSWPPAVRDELRDWAAASAAEPVLVLNRPGSIPPGQGVLEVDGKSRTLPEHATDLRLALNAGRVFIFVPAGADGSPPALYGTFSPEAP